MTRGTVNAIYDERDLYTFCTILHPSIKTRPKARRRACRTARRKVRPKSRFKSRSISRSKSRRKARRKARSKTSYFSIGNSTVISLNIKIYSHEIVLN